MRGRSSLIGAAFATTTAVTWGGQFVVGKSALDRVNAFPLSTVRYAVAAGLWLVVLAAVEGRGSLRLAGRGLRLFWLGTFGFLALALAGVVLVISGGHPSTIVNGSIGWGDALVLAGVFSFVLYGLGAAQFTDFSPLRYTTLTAALGWLTIAAATAIALAAGLVPTPSGSTLAATTPQIAYLALPGAFLAVLTWNAAIGIIGPQNAVLFGNLIPVTTFAIEIVRGYRPNAVELGGAALTIVALVANNLVARRAESATAVERGYEELLEAA